jgi:hypothetical protein
MPDDFRKIDAQAVIAMLQADPRVSKNLRKIVAKAKTYAKKEGILSYEKVGRTSTPVIRVKQKDPCNGCFGCLACGVSPTPDIEIACIATVTSAF